MIVIDIKGVKMRFVFVPLNLIGYAYGEMYDFVWQELLNNGYLNSAIFLTFSLFSDEVSKLRIYGGFEEGYKYFKGVLGNSHDIISLCL